jgi:5-methylcytosine-specific restriction endonuclease McrA
MWAVPRPQASAESAYATCISRIRPPQRQLFEAAIPEARVAGDDFAAAVAAGKVHRLDKARFHSSTVAKDGLVRNYTQRMVPRGSAGRAIYDALKLAAPNGICPLCGQRTVATLDHYMPKTQFPLLAVAPDNLVPACADCNHLKGETEAAGAMEVPFHPYFEDFDEDIWLVAHIVESAPGGAVFSVVPPASWTATLAARARMHFGMLKLAPLYASHAGVELQGIRGAMRSAHSRGGPDSVRLQLADQADSRRVPTVNNWASALYRALAANDWYCEGGFLTG